MIIRTALAVVAPIALSHGDAARKRQHELQENRDGKRVARIKDNPVQSRF
jgi:hypothetical protein